MAKNKLSKSQVWVETVIYTLIGLTIIAIILTGALPQIEKAKDRQVIKQTIETFGMFNTKISETSEAPSNIRIFQFKIAKGRIEIDGENDTIYYILENTKLKFSEPGEVIKENDLVSAETIKSGSKYNIILAANYSREVNVTYNQKEERITFQPGASLYKIAIENKGINANSGLYQIDFNMM